MLSDLNENYHLRKCFLKSEEVPTQSLMKKKMGKPLAEVYFQTMHPAIKILGGICPPLKGPGSRLWIPPQSYLNEDVKLNPAPKEKCVEYMNQSGIEVLARYIKVHEDEALLEIIKNALVNSDSNWKMFINQTLKNKLSERLEHEKKIFIESVKSIVRENEMLYTSFITHLEDHLLTVSNALILEEKETSKRLMEERLKGLIQEEHNMLTLKYRDILNKNKDYRYNIFKGYISKETNKFIYKLMAVREEKYELLNILKSLEQKNRKLMIAKKRNREQIKHTCHEVFSDSVIVSSCGNKSTYLIREFSLFSQLCKDAWPQHTLFFDNMEELLGEYVMKEISETSINKRFDGKCSKFTF